MKARSGKVKVVALRNGLVCPVSGNIADGFDEDFWICKFWKKKIFNTEKPEAGTYEVSFTVKKLPEKKK